MDGSSSHRVHKSLLNTTLLVVGLGYFIDSCDIFLYNALRVPSLHDLGLGGDGLIKTGLNILSIQVLGMLIGGLVWGILGDRIGRKKALIGSVLFYSFGSLGCAIVPNVEAYAFLRFLTGIGLAGEIGLGAILVTETLPDAKRSWAIAIFTAFAYCGTVSANILAEFMPWRMCYAIGGALGLIVLLGRAVLFESSLYEHLAKQTMFKRGSLIILFGHPKILRRWLCCIFFMMPYFYVVNILITLAPEFGKALHVATPIKANTAMMAYAECSIIGAMLNVVVSDLLRKRITAVVAFMLLNLGLSVYYLLQDQAGETAFYAVCCFMGMANYFVLLLFASIEQFGTNIRATSGTSAISIGRTTLVLSNAIFLAFKSSGFSIIHAALGTGVIVFAMGFACLAGLHETYHQSMDFLEEA